MNVGRIFRIVLIAILVAATAIAGQTPGEGGVLPEIRLEARGEAQSRYLGLNAGAAFVPQKLPAEAVIIEIFSMY